MNTIEIAYQGPIIGANTYRGKHWRVAKKEIDLVKQYMFPIVHNANLPIIGKYKVFARYGSSHDDDNIAAGNLKIFNDMLIKQGRIIDDRPKYMKGICVDHDETLAKDQIFFTIKIIQ